LYIAKHYMCKNIKLKLDIKKDTELFFQFIVEFL
jgi:hypothetical protein